MSVNSVSNNEYSYYSTTGSSTSADETDSLDFSETELVDDEDNSVVVDESSIKKTGDGYATDGGKIVAYTAGYKAVDSKTGETIKTSIDLK
ncbi:MAG: hypothetical protein LUE64_03355 [Candidatus Gastranaerophilales bacterium]|nr:hypothetical protein [Candidatus Gastranaerophilales bacterium]